MRTTSLLVISIIALLSISATAGNTNPNNIDNSQRSQHTSLNPECTICHEVIDPVAGGNSDNRLSMIHTNGALTDTDIATIIASIR